jgi:hypothetical protein
VRAKRNFLPVFGKNCSRCGAECVPGGERRPSGTDFTGYDGKASNFQKFQGKDGIHAEVWSEIRVAVI